MAGRAFALELVSVWRDARGMETSPVNGCAQARFPKGLFEYAAGSRPSFVQ